MPFPVILPNGQPAYVNEDGSVSPISSVEQETSSPSPNTVAEAGAAPPPPPPTAIPGQSAGPQLYNRGVSASFSGYDPNKLARAEGRLEGNYAEAEADGQRLYQGLAQPYVDASNARADNVITAEQAQGAPSMYEAQEYQRQGQILAQTRQAKMYADFAAEEHRANQYAMAKVAQSKQEYLSQVQAYQAMSVNPGQLMGNMSQGARAATFASVFVHDFLGAKGIRTSAMDTINRAIDQNIDAQKANIDKQGNVAEHFKALYQMAVNESATEQEARTRMRGFYLAQMEKEITAELLKYDAPLARAKAAEARLMFQEEQAKNLFQVGKFVTERVDVAKQRALELRGIESREAMHRQSIGVQYAQLDLDQQKLDAAKGGPADRTRIVKNPFNGQDVAVAVNDEGWKRVNDQAQFTSEFTEALDQYLKLAADVGAVYNGKFKESLNSEQEQQLSAAREAVRWKYVQARSGKTMTATEFAMSNQILPIDGLLRKGGVSRIIEQTGAEVTSAWEKAFNLYADPLPGMTRDEANVATLLKENYLKGAYGQPAAPTGVQETIDQANRPHADRMSNVTTAATVAISQAQKDPENAATILRSTIGELEEMVNNPDVGLSADGPEIQKAINELRDAHRQIVGPLPGEKEPGWNIRKD